MSGNGSNASNTLYIGNLYEEELPDHDAPATAYISYYYLGAKLVGMRRVNQNPLEDPPTIGQFRVVGDQLGSTTLVVDMGTQNRGPEVVYRQYFKPYGEVAYSYSGWNAQRGIPTSFGFTGKRLDDDTELMYFGARYYDPVLSYFLSADPTVLDPQNARDLVRYLYVRGNPLRFIDTSGYGPDDYYVFVNGCVSGCGDSVAQRSGWQEYQLLLRMLFYVGGWGKNWHGSGSDISFEKWAWDPAYGEHVRYVAAVDPYKGAALIARKLHDIPGNSSIHLIGHSYGGAAILEYLKEREYEEKLYGYGQTLDRRIRTVTLIDAPISASDHMAY